jgi:uncharacterized RDD family membrane protein YckC
MARKESSEEPLLFDLPLGKSGERAGEPELLDGQRRGQDRRAGLDSLTPLGERPEGDGTKSFEEPDGSGSAASMGSRLLAGLADGVVHAAVAVLGVLGAQQVGARPALADWPGFALFLLAFSFLYVVVSLAFWGHTLGMVWAGITARGRDGDALSFDQAVRRWLGGILTSSLVGLPLLVSIRGRTVTDLLSSSETLRR